MFVSKWGRYHWARVSAMFQSWSAAEASEVEGGGERREESISLKPDISSSVGRR